MSHTKMHPRPGEAATHPPLPNSEELQIRLACSGKSAVQVLEELQCGIANAAAADRYPLVVLEDLGRLEDSVVAFIKGLSRMMVDYPGPVTFWESSGYTEAFLSVMDQKQDP